MDAKTYPDTTIQGRLERVRRAAAPASGMTLLEVMIAVTILTIVLGILFGLAVSLGDTARVQEAKTTTFDEARKGMIYMARDLRQAQNFGLSALPADTVTYCIATDVDGNGTAVDMSGRLELSAPRTITRDVDDLNGDGLTDSQLLLWNGETGMVLANGLLPDEDLNDNGDLDADEDTNGNGLLDHGVWLERTGGGVLISLQTLGTSRQGHPLVTNMQTTIVPRN